MLCRMACMPDAELPLVTLLIEEVPANNELILPLLPELPLVALNKLESEEPMPPPIP